MTDQNYPPTRTSRRRLLRTAAAAGSIPLVAGSASAQNRITRRMVIPAVEEFANSYQGQFVFVDETSDADASEVPIEDCTFEWPVDETQAYEGQLLDRRQELPLAVDLTVYMDGRKAQVEPGTYFIVQGTAECPGDWIGLEGESVPRRSLAGKDPGPTVTPTDSPGFGVAAALLGAAGAAVVRFLRGD